MLFDVIGMIGVTAILTMYALVQFDRMNVKSMRYSVFNALGAGLVLVSLWVDFNLSAFVIEFFWLIFSCLGIYTASRKKTELHDLSADS